MLEVLVYNAREQAVDDHLLLDGNAFGTSTPVGLANSEQSRILFRKLPFPTPAQNMIVISVSDTVETRP